MPVQLAQELVFGTPLRAGFEAKSTGQFFQIFGLLGQLVQGKIMDNTQPAFHQTQEVVAGDEGGVFLFGKKSTGAQHLESFPGIGGPQSVQIAAIADLKELDEKFNVDDAAKAALQIAFAATGLEPLAHIADFLSQLGFPGQAIGALGHDRHDFAGENRIAEDYARPRQRLPLPELGAAFAVILLELAQRNHQAARFAGGP